MHIYEQATDSGGQRPVYISRAVKNKLSPDSDEPTQECHRINEKTFAISTVAGVAAG